MKKESIIFLSAIILIPLGVLLGLELALRESSAFNNFVFRNSSPRHSDHFRLYYRLRKAKNDPAPAKVAFLGSSVTRDGIDARIFRQHFPGTSFYNLGSTFKIPRYERPFLRDYRKAGFRVLVYPVTAVDIFKFRSPSVLPIYPDFEELKELVRRGEFAEILENRTDLIGTALGAFSLAVRFRQVVPDAFYNYLFKSAGYALVPDFDFFWQQQNLDDQTVLDYKFRYADRRPAFFQERLKSAAKDLEYIASRLKNDKTKLVIYHMPGACSRFLDRLDEDVKKAASQFGDLLLELAARHPHVQYFKGNGFACEQYAETFHLNAEGRRAAFEQLAPIIAPLLPAAGVGQ